MSSRYDPAKETYQVETNKHGAWICGPGLVGVAKLVDDARTALAALTEEQARQVAILMGCAYYAGKRARSADFVALLGLSDVARGREFFT